MAINLSCPGCSTKYKIEDRNAGKKFRCKRCDKVLTIPQPAASLEREPEPTESMPAASDSFDDSDAIDESTTIPQPDAPLEPPAALIEAKPATDASVDSAPVDESTTIPKLDVPSEPAAELIEATPAADASVDSAPVDELATIPLRDAHSDRDAPSEPAVELNDAMPAADPSDNSALQDESTTIPKLDAPPVQEPKPDQESKPERAPKASKRPAAKTFDESDALDVLMADAPTGAPPEPRSKSSKPANDDPFDDADTSDAGDSAKSASSNKPKTAATRSTKTSEDKALDNKGGPGDRVKAADAPSKPRLATTAPSAKRSSANDAADALKTKPKSTPQGESEEVGLPAIVVYSLAAAAAGLVGAALWTGVAFASEREIGLIAVAIGGMVGLAVRMTSREHRDGTMPGSVAAFASVASIGLGKCLSTLAVDITLVEMISLFDILFFLLAAASAWYVGLDAKHRG